MNTTIINARNLVLTSCLMVLVGNASAEDSAQETHHETHAPKRHNIGVFLGQTNGDHSEFTFGLEYEYKFNHQWGAGLTFEKTPDAHNGDGVDVQLASLYLHPYKNFRFGLGYGEEKIRGSHPESEDLVRLAVSYDFHINKHLGLAPSFAIDRVDGETLRVYGVSLTIMF